MRVGIACHKSVAVAGFGGCGADGIREIGPREGERVSDDVVVNRCNGKGAKETLHPSRATGGDTFGPC